jgi:hypothetical protein
LDFSLSQFKSAGAESFPRTAVAAATAGDTKCVRPPLPWRPSKLRFDVAAQRSPGASWSVHPQTPRAAGLPPFGTGGGEDLAQTFFFGLCAYPH